MSQRIFSGIRATGRLHLGNYLGAIKGMLELQDNPDYEMLFAVVDLHAMTTPYNKESLAKDTYEVVLDYLAAGMDPEKSHLILQSQVADLHTELMMYFSTVVTVPRMQHLPTYKDKIRQHPEDVTMALLNYPILMAADILMYKSSLVPVGVDQEPHLEVTREIARKMNEKYGTDFPEPKRFATEGEYVPSLKGEGKMSKTVEGSYINLGDNLEAIKDRLAGAPTDSGQGETIPQEGGVANLLKLVELFEGKEKRAGYEAAYRDQGIRYQEMKNDLAEAIYRTLEPIQAKRQELEANPDYVNQVLEKGKEAARAYGRETIDEVRQAMGIYRR